MTFVIASIIVSVLAIAISIWSVLTSRRAAIRMKEARKKLEAAQEKERRRFERLPEEDWPTEGNDRGTGF